MGYNLAIEYLADYEKTWMLDSFRALNERVLAPAGRPLTEWIFLEVGAPSGRVQQPWDSGCQGPAALGQGVPGCSRGSRAGGQPPTLAGQLATCAPPHWWGQQC